MTPSKHSPPFELERFYPALLFLLTVVVYVLPSSRAILDDGDALYAHIAQQMVSSGDWVTPHANGVRFLDKPPLMFWLMAASFRVFGVHEWAARLPTALGIAGTAWILWRLAGDAAGKRAGLYAGLAFVLSAGTLFFTIEAFPDIFLVFFLSLACYSLLRMQFSSGRSLWPVFGYSVALAGAVLAKSLIGLVFPLATGCLFFLVVRQRPRLRALHLLLGVAILLAATVPWHVLAAQRNPGFLNHYFVNEQLMRFLGRRQPVDYGSIPVPIFWLLLLVWVFPWCAFLAASWGLRKRLTDADERQAAVIQLAWCWSGVVITFFTFSARLEHYSFPALPPFALLVGIALARGSDKSVEKRVAGGFAALGLLGVVAAIMAPGVLIWWMMAGARAIGATTGATSDHAYTNLFSPLFDLPATTRSQLVWPLVGALASFAIGTLIACWLHRKRRQTAAVLSLAAMMTFFCFFALYSLHLCEGLLSSKAFGMVLKDVAGPGTPVVVVGDFEFANSINFYAPVQLFLLEGRAASIEQGLRYSDAPRMIISREELDKLWLGRERAFLLSSTGEMERGGPQPAFPILEHSGRRLVCNQPVKN